MPIGSVGDPAVSRNQDAATKFCTFLLTRLSWPPSKIASRLSIPVVVVEECFRRARASTLLKRQVAHWVREAGEVPHLVPSSLLADVLNEAEEDDLVVNENADINFGLDSATREHFKFLQQSIGHNFISILNDPTAAGNSTEGKWFFSFGSAPVQPATAPPQPLMPKVYISHDEFDTYLKDVTPLFKENQILIQQEVRRARTSEEAHASTMGSVCPKSVPNEYYSKDFSPDWVLLSVPLDGGSATADVSDDEALIEMQINQLQVYEDHIECVLISQVQSKSEQFFAASKLFNELHGDVQAALKALSSARIEVSEGAGNTVRNFIHISSLYKRRANLSAALAVMEQFFDLQRRCSNVEHDIQAKQFLAGVKEITSCYDEVSRSRFLEDILVFRGTLAAMSELRKDLLMAILNGVETELNHSQWEKSMESWEPIADMLAAAHELGCLGGCLQQYHQAAVDGVTNVLHEAVIEALCRVTPSDSQNEIRPDNCLHLLAKSKVTHFVQIVSCVLERMLEYVHRAVAHKDMIVASLPQPRSAEEWREHNVSLYNILQSAVAVLFECRNDETMNLRLCDMETIMRSSFAFIENAENLLDMRPCTAPLTDTGRMSYVGHFRAVLLTQARAFFKKQHERQQQKMLMVLSQEQWVPEDKIEHVFQKYVISLCDSSPESVRFARSIAVDATATHGRQPEEESEHFEKRMFLPSHEEGFVVGNSVLMLVQSLYDYDRYLCTFPFLGGDIVMRIHELLKLYDGQCAALVLGAAAVETGAFESIHAAHLALASQCIAFLAAFTPLLQARLAQLCDSKTANFVKTLSRVERDLEEHRDEFYIKIISMLREKVDALSIDPTEWSAHGYTWIMSLLKEALRLMKNLKPIMNRVAIRAVMVPVFANYIQRLKNAAREACSSDASVKQRVIDDLLVFKVNVEKVGFSIAQCNGCLTVAAAMKAEPQLSSDNDEKTVRQIFFDGL